MSAERTTGTVAAVVLAAGSSRRMGRNKLFLSLGGESVLRRAVGVALAAGLHPVLVVLGHAFEQARAELSGLACTPIHNADHAQGLNGSLRAGLAAVPQGVPAALVMLADMPLVTASMLRTLVEHYRAGSAPLVVSNYQGVTAPPTLYDRSLFSEFASARGDGAGKRVVELHRSEAAEVSWPASALADLDVPEDLDRVRAEWEDG